MSRAVRLLALLLSLAGIGRGLAAQEAEPVLIELQLGRLTSKTVEAFRAGDAALIPVGAFFDLAETHTARQANGSLEALVQPGNLRFVLDPASKTLTLGKDRISLTADQLQSTPTDVYLDTRVLGRALQLDWDVSWQDLEVTVLDPASLPVARRLQREAMLSARLASSSAPEYTGLRLGLERPRMNGMVFDYSLLTPTTGLDAGAYSTMLGLDVFGGSFGLGLQSQDGPNRAPRADIGWSGIWRESHWLTQAHLGDGISTGPRSRSVRGFSLSNSPFVRPMTIGNLPFTGQLGTGWSIEAYRGGRLIGFDSVNALGQFSFDLPIEYGENPVDFIAYGPFGEIREFNQTYRLRTDALPAHQFEYGLSLGQCRTDQCTATGNVDLRYGLSTRWSARAGFDGFWRNQPTNLMHPYAGIAGSITNAVSLEAEAVRDAVVRGSVRFEPSTDLQLQVDAYHFATQVRDPILTPQGRTEQVTLSAFFRPISRMGGNYLEASLDRINSTSGMLTSGRLGASVQVAEIRILPAVRFQRADAGFGPQTSQTFLGVNTFILPRQGLGPVFGSISARTSFEMQPGVGAVNASAYIGAPIIKGLRAETGMTWFRGGRGPGFSLLIAAELPSVRSYTTLTAGGGAEPLGTQYISGSTIYNPTRGSMDFSSNPGLSRGGVTGRVFLDLNGNGHMDGGEQPLAGVRIVVGGIWSTSDSSGRYRAWDLLPYEPTTVVVDSSTLASPLWVPAFAAASVEPSPNRYRTLDIPVLPGGVVEGRVAGTRMGGITLRFKHKASGEQRILTTFSDGTFYGIGFRPGDWELTVDPKCLEVLKAAAEPLAFTLLPSEEGSTAEGLEVQLYFATDQNQ
ncbi:MAG TPA: hypothetical protein VH438_17180 [Gemmatimonadales bacterium]